jgi:hypothetical protein
LNGRCSSAAGFTLRFLWIEELNEPFKDRDLENGINKGIPQELVDSFLDEAIEDLRKRGLSNEEILVIIKEQFSPRYLNKVLEIQ